MAPRPIKALGQGCKVMAQSGSLASGLENTPQYSRQKCMASSHVQQRIYIGPIRTKASILYWIIK
jgi:hypothetical protein